MIDNNEDNRTIWCGNLSDKVTDAILYELFLQGGPLERVSIPRDRDGRPRTFGFVTYVHKISVPYALNLFKGTCLFNKSLSMKCRNSNNSQQIHKPEINIQQKFNGSSNASLSNGLSNMYRSKNMLPLTPNTGRVILPNTFNYDALLQLGSQMYFGANSLPTPAKDTYKGSISNYNKNNINKSVVTELTDNRDRSNERHVRHQSDRRNNRNKRTSYNYDKDRKRTHY